MLTRVGRSVIQEFYINTNLCGSFTVSFFSGPVEIFYMHKSSGQEGILLEALMLS